MITFYLLDSNNVYTGKTVEKSKYEPWGAKERKEVPPEGNFVQWNGNGYNVFENYPTQVVVEYVPTDSELKEIGLPYTLNGVEYQVPLNESTQLGMTTIGVQYLAGMFNGTVFHFSNGVKMPLAVGDFMQFAQWFAVERGKFFKLEETNV